ncbi:MAG: hypothetical protein AAFV43_12580 [Planctomycetota bacterium]
MKPFARVVVGVVVAAAVSAGSAAESPNFASILGRIPGGANALVMLNAEKILGSEVGLREGWRQKYEDNRSGAPLRIPPEARQFVLAAELDLSTLTPRWEAASMRTEADIPISVVQRIVNGKPDRFGDLEATVSPRGAYIVRFGPNEYGMMHAGDRQTVARWLSRGREGVDANLSTYLAEAATYPDRSGTEIIMAVDLGNALGRSAVESAAEVSPVLKKAAVDTGEAVDVLTSLRGVTLGVRVTDKAYGSLKVDFEKPIAPIASVAKPLLLEALAEAGVSIEEFYDWELQTSTDAFRISGVFTASGLKRVFSFLELDATAVDSGEANVADAAAGDPSDRYRVDVEKTKTYFDAVEEYLDDLSRETGAKSYYSIATWFEKYAKRIDRLPILGVDPDLVDYGAYTVSQLYSCAEAIRGAGIRSGSRGSTVTGGGGNTYGYGSRPYTNSLFAGSVYDAQVAGVRAAEADRIAIRKQERANSSTTVRGLMTELREQTSSIRRGLTERYQAEF